MAVEERFHKAASDGYMDLLHEATKRDLNQPDEDGMTPTLWAASRGNLDALRVIIGRGGNPDKADYLGRTALHHAAIKGRFDCVSYLVSWGCNIWALDNDHHDAFDISSIYERQDIIKYLDNVRSVQQTKNRKTVDKLKEKSVVEAEKNVRRYEKLKDEATRKAEKEDRKYRQRSSIDIRDGIPTGKTTIKEKLKTLTLRYKSRPRVYDEYGHNSNISHGTTKKGDKFNVGEVDESGKRTIRSLSGLKGGTEVMYVPDKRLSGAFLPNDINGDSGIDNDDDDDITSGSIFNRPGVGRMAFLPRNPAAASLCMLPQNENFIDEEPDPALHYFDNKHDSISDSIGTTDSLVQRMGDLPWNEEEVENLDDDDELLGYSSLELFLVTCGLTEYLAVFTKEKIDLDALMLLSNDDMKLLGLEMGPRTRLKNAIKKRQDIIQNPGVIYDSNL